MIPENKVFEMQDKATAGSLRYFSLFKYPLRPDEVHRFCQYPYTQDECDQSIERLLHNGIIKKTSKFYQVKGDESWAVERKKGNVRALSLLDNSGKYVRIIASFPFVEAIAISGSLSKYYAGEVTDIDYFIISKSNRLWIARSLLHLFKKLTFVTGHQHYFCMNYFIDEDAIVLEDRNIYSAIETVTLIPVFNAELIAKMKSSNNWIGEILPNDGGDQDMDYLVNMKRPILRKTAEFIINLLFPSAINKALMKITDIKWRRKWGKKGYSGEKYDRAFHTTLQISRNHPIDFQEKILKALDYGGEILHNK